MVQAKKVTIARFTGAGDDFTTTDRIDFNDVDAVNAKDSKKEGAYFRTFQVIEPEGLGVNQAAEKPDGNVQALGVIEKTYILTGWITKTDGNNNDGVNAFLTQLLSWKEDPSILKDVWEAGRFGVLDENDTSNNLTPIGTGVNAIGLIFNKYTKTYDPIRNRTDIIITFRRSRGADI